MNRDDTGPGSEFAAPSRARLISAAIFVLLITLAVWKFIDYRSQPPPPPHKIGERVEIK